MDDLLVLPIPGGSLDLQPTGPAARDQGGRSGAFWVGPENRLVGVAVEAILNGPDHGLGPVVLSGPCGTGKTHLAMGLVAVYRGRSRQRSALYATAVDFGKELADAIETQATDDFRDRYRRVSLLAIDDVDRLAEKDASQRELACTLDAVLEAGGQVVLTSSVAPGQLTGFLPHLRSRLVQGLMVPLALPGEETRAAIAMRIAELRGLHLGRREAEALAAGVRASVPRLAGALASLQAESGSGRAITVAMVEQYVAGQRSGARRSLREIATVVARHFSLRVADLRSPSRRRAVVVARGIAMYLARLLTRGNLRRIGAYFNGRDHTTVSHGCWKTKAMLGADRVMRDAVESLCAQLERAGT